MSFLHWFFYHKEMLLTHILEAVRGTGVCYVFFSITILDKTISMIHFKIVWKFSFLLQDKTCYSDQIERKREKKRLNKFFSEGIIMQDSYLFFLEKYSKLQLKWYSKCHQVFRWAKTCRRFFGLIQHTNIIQRHYKCFVTENWLFLSLILKTKIFS